MSEGSSSKETSSLILVSYRELHESLLASDGLKNIHDILKARLPHLRKWADPFGKPSPESKKALESGEVKFIDGSKTRVSDEEKEEALKISARFQLDEVEALVLLRSCFAHADPSSLDPDAGGHGAYESELQDALETYYFEQRHHLLRVFLSLLAASVDTDHPFHAPATDTVQSLMPDYGSFSLDLLNEIDRRARQPNLSPMILQPSTASRWARQSIREQLCLLEILFAVLWEINPCPSTLVLRVFEVLFASDFGQTQASANHLMDEEGSQLLADLECFWVLIVLQIIALDDVIGRDTMKESLLEDPKALLSLHNLIISSFRTKPRYSPLIMAWGIVLFHFTNADTPEPKSGPLATFFETIVPPTPAAPFSRNASAVTTPNSFPYRLAIHYLVIGMTETIQIGQLTDIDPFISVVEALFGSGERNIAASLCHKYWTEDWVASTKRQQLLQVAALRFPVQPQPLVRLLRALSGNGSEIATIILNGFAHVIQASDLQGSAYDVRSDVVLNVRAINLPGGTSLSARTVGQMLSMRSPGSPLAVRWSHTYSGWRVLLDILLEHLRGAHNTGSSQAVTRHMHLSLADIGMEDSDLDPLVCDILALFRCVAEGNISFARLLMENISGEIDETDDLSSPDLVQVARIILENCLSHAVPTTVKLATNALGILMALLPVYPGRVWPFLRSTQLLFSTSLFASERALGTYPMTTAVVELVSALHNEARVMALRHSSQRVLQHMKSDVLLKGLTFIHNEVWLGYSGWRFAQLSDRFKIGHRVTELYCAILEGPSGSLGDDIFEPLAAFLVDAFLQNATVPCVAPLVSAIAHGHELLRSLNQAHRFAEANSLSKLLSTHLKLIELLIARKSPDSGVCLLEQTLFTLHKKRSPIDAIVLLVEDKLLPLEAINVLTILVNTPISMISHFSSPRRTTDALLHMVQHPYDDLRVRVAICTFISRCIAAQPVLAKLFVSGEFKVTSDIALGNSGSSSPEAGSRLTALPIALEIVSNWELLWDSNPELLSAALEILDSIWERAPEHTSTLEPIRKGTQFWIDLSSLASKELHSPETSPTITHLTINESVIESDLEGLPTTCYQAVIKAYAVHILSLDISLSPTKDGAPAPSSLTAFEKGCKDIKTLVSHAVQCGNISDSTNEVRKFLDENIPGFNLDAYRTSRLGIPQQFGDNYLIDLPKVKKSIWQYFESDAGRESWNRELLRQLCQLNIEWSLIDSRTSLTRSWVRLLSAVASWFCGKPSMRTILMECASSVAKLTGNTEQRGDAIESIHTERINILLALAETIGFSGFTEAELTKHFITFSEHLQLTLVNPLFPLLESVQDAPNKGFHRGLLQIVYFTALHAQKLSSSGSKLTAAQRQVITSVITSALDFVINSLRINFDAARSSLSQDVDSDMQLLTSTFGQLVKPDLLPNSSTWLARCQSSDIIRASLELFVRLDLTGQAYPEQYRTNHQTLYARSIFDFHTILVSYSHSAERLAHENILLAYGANQLAPALEAGVVDVIHADLPGERSPAHRTWCKMLRITSALIGHLSYNSHFVDLDVTSFVQLYRRQIMRTLEWSVGDSLTAPLLDEMTHVVELFHAIAEVASHSSGKSGAAAILGRDFVRIAHRLLQHLGYALAHPNHVLGLLEPLTADERALIEADEAAEVETTVGIIDPVKRPVLARVGIALFRLFGADDVIVKLDETEWDHTWEKLQPTVSVSIEESSSIGTMIELGRTAIDVLRHLNSFKTPPAPSQGLTTPLLALPKFEIKAAQSQVQTALELLLAYSASQIALWLREEDSERWEREIKGTVAEDVQTLLSRAVGTVGGKDSEGAGLFEVLAGFLEGKLSA
ncbi:nucleoporin subcomplex protein binding to Pom34-domain-containing protein [Rhizoctonia solani]|nr:nucleoporin subcomplex protein binding to Pom34-domain-containing protein [Rhizoctonia solani]